MVTQGSTAVLDTGSVPENPINWWYDVEKAEMKKELTEKLEALSKIKNAFEAMNYILYQIFPQIMTGGNLGGGGELQISELGTNLKALSTDASMLAYIKKVFNDAANGTATPDELKQAALYVNTLASYLQQQVAVGAIPQSFYDSVMGDLSSITGYSVGSIQNGEVNGDQLGVYWKAAWGKNNEQLLQSIQNGFDSASTNLTGTSQIVQSNLKFTEQEFQQIEGTLKQLYQAQSKQEQASVNGMRQS